MSYRREETAYAAGWVFDRLRQRFGRGNIFRDIDSIELGDDFVDVIKHAVGRCDVLLALIGDQWLTVTDAGGRRRLDDPEDFVRLEIEAALTRHVRVVPILIDGARMPHEHELPPSLRPLVRRHALDLSPSRFDSDIALLFAALDRALAEVHDHPEPAAVPVLPPAEPLVPPDELLVPAESLAPPDEPIVPPVEHLAPPAENLVPAEPLVPPAEALAPPAEALVPAEPLVPPAEALAPPVEPRPDGDPELTRTQPLPLRLPPPDDRRATRPGPLGDPLRLDQGDRFRLDQPDPFGLRPGPRRAHPQPKTAEPRLAGHNGRAGLTRAGLTRAGLTRTGLTRAGLGAGSRRLLRVPGLRAGVGAALVVSVILATVWGFSRGRDDGVITEPDRTGTTAPPVVVLPTSRSRTRKPTPKPTPTIHRTRTTTSRPPPTEAPCISVPDVIGTLVDDGSRQLALAGLRYRKVADETTEDYPPDTVVDQNPLNACVQRGSTITLIYTVVPEPLPPTTPPPTTDPGLG